MSPAWLVDARSAINRGVGLFPKECALWVLLDAGSSTITVLVNRSPNDLALLWLFPECLTAIYLILAATWLGMGQTSFRQLYWEDLWRVGVATMGVLFVSFPLAVVGCLGLLADRYLQWPLQMPMDAFHFYMLSVPFWCAVTYASARLCYAPYLVLDRGARPGDAILGSLARSRHELGPLLVLVGGPLGLSSAFSSAQNASGYVMAPGLIFATELLQAALVLAGLLAVGQRYQAAHGDQQRGSLIRDPFFAVTFLLCLLCLPVASYLAIH